MKSEYGLQFMPDYGLVLYESESAKFRVAEISRSSFEREQLLQQLYFMPISLFREFQHFDYVRLS